MKKEKLLRFYMLFIACYFLCVSCQQESRQVKESNIEQRDTLNGNKTGIEVSKRSSLLWKIEGDGMQTSYLFGTIHVLPQKDFLLKEKVVKAFNACQKLIMEVEDINAGGAQMMQEIKMEDGKTLHDFVSEEEYMEMDKNFKKMMGTSLDAFKEMKPIIISATLIMPLLGEMPASFEESLSKMAKDKSMPIAGLETIEEQIAVLGAVGMEDQLKSLKELLEDTETAKKQFEDMLLLYKKEDIDTLYAFTDAYMESDSMATAMLHQRNHNWIPLIQKAIAEKSIFIAVGAGHLGGEQGLVALLRREGLRLNPIF